MAAADPVSGRSACARTSRRSSPGTPSIPTAAVGAVSAAPHGSAGILPIPWMYIEMMGGRGLTEATDVAMLSANYIAERLDRHFPVLYRGANGRVAHECIIDIRPITKATGVTVDDIAKRLMDYGFHAPTMSFPVAGTLMIEPTESETLRELDRFCDAMIAIAAEIDRVASGEWPVEQSPLRHAPHTAEELLGDWDRPYSREVGAFPSPRCGWRSTSRRCRASTVPTATATSCARASRSRPTPPHFDPVDSRCGERTAHPSARSLIGTFRTGRLA